MAPIDPEVGRRRMQRNAELVSLGTHPAWPAMKEEVAVRQAQFERRVLTAALRVEGVDQREIDYLRGFLAGIAWLTGIPDKAERDLEKVLAEQGITLEEDVA